MKAGTEWGPVGMEAGVGGERLAGGLLGGLPGGVLGECPFVRGGSTP
ncbi:hypothetical protein [Streptomyces roseolus]